MLKTCNTSNKNISFRPTHISRQHTILHVKCSCNDMFMHQHVHADFTVMWKVLVLFSFRYLILLKGYFTYEFTI